MGGLSIILKQSLPSLKKLYEVDYPLHAITTIAIHHFIERFKKKPEWEEKVKFLSLNDNWKKTGTFAMVNANDNHILFNTLESWPYESLRKTLNLLNYDQPTVFACFRDVFRPVVFDAVRIQNLEITFDTGTKNIFKEYGNIDIDAPVGYYFDSLNQSNVEKLNSKWIQRYTHSYDYLSNCIAENPSTGLFNQGTGELVSWSITLETGAAGHLYVDEKYRGKGFGGILFAKHINKVGNELGYDMTGHIVHYNKTSFHMTKKMGCRWIDNNSWIGVRPKPTPKLVSIWGI